jgi:hypothetical protein
MQAIDLQSTPAITQDAAQPKKLLVADHHGGTIETTRA